MSSLEEVISKLEFTYPLFFVKLLGADEIFYIWKCEQLDYFHLNKRLLPELGA